LVRSTSLYPQERIFDHSLRACHRPIIGGLRASAQRRRRAALGTLCGLAAVAFAFGALVDEWTESRANGEGRGARWVEAAERLSPARLAGQRLIAGFDGARVPVRLRRLIGSGGVAGVLLFEDNLPSRAAGRRLIGELQAIPRPRGLRDPLLVMVDQEGGLVKRLSGAPEASAQRMAARGRAYSRLQGRLTGRDLRGVGVNVDLAPVLAVARPGSEMELTGRAWGSTPRRVAATAVPFARALQASGVAATAKHFPGLGAVRGDTDTELERIGLSKAELRAIDEAPYRGFVAAGGKLVMVSMAIYPAFSDRPAAFTRSIATGELRGRLGFGGVSVTDALDTTSALSAGGSTRAGLLAARAGVDLLLYAGVGPALRARRALAKRLPAGSAARAGSERSAARVLRLRHGLR
jgi:beta-N-acetylhexosaminidase